MSIIDIEFIVVHTDDYNQSYQMAYPGKWNTQTQEIIPVLPNGYDDGFITGFLMKLPSGTEVDVVWDNENQAFRIKEDDEYEDEQA